MAMLKFYIAGPITGVDNFEVPFMLAETKIVEMGHIVLNPAKLPGGMSQHDYMDICLAMVRAADVCYFLTGWEKSEGAKLEYQYAEKTGKIICLSKKELSKIIGEWR